MRYFRSLAIHVENASAVFVSLEQNFVIRAQGKAFGIEIYSETDIHSLGYELIQLLRLSSESVDNPRHRRLYLLMNGKEFGKSLYAMYYHRLAHAFGNLRHLAEVKPCLARTGSHVLLHFLGTENQGEEYANDECID